MTQIEKLTRQCYAMKLKALDMALASGSFGSHIGGAFSSMELLSCLFEIANIDPIRNDRDRVIISKGHAVLSLYTALWQRGYITDEELKTYDQNGTSFHGHPNRNLNKGIEFSSGSLGLGLSYAVGIALACKKKELNNTVFSIIGDGECDEGIIWEATQTASQYKLNNLTIIVDNNRYQLDGITVEIIDQSHLAEKFKAFGFDVVEIDGHDISSLLQTIPIKTEHPRVIIANTVKAHGISFLENNKLSHHCSLTKKKYLQAVDDIKSSYGLDQV